MLTNEQLTQLETRLLAQLRGEDGDLAVLLAHIAQLTNHNRVMQVALAQFSSGVNWRHEFDAEFVPPKYQLGYANVWNGDSNPAELACQALVNTAP